MFKLGLIVNPAAGMGESNPAHSGRSRLCQEEPSFGHVEKALAVLHNIEAPFEIITCSGIMGGNICLKLHLQHAIIYDCNAITSCLDTKTASAKMLRLGIDLLMFAGGDGTALDVQDTVGTAIPVLGVAIGNSRRKSPVFADSPTVAGELLQRLLLDCMKAPKNPRAMASR